MKKILLVEDDHYIQDIYHRVFSNAGYEITLAKDGEAGVNMAKSNIYDVILLDIMMPKMNGIEVLKILRAPGSPAIKTPIFLLTNLGQDNIIKECFGLGADGFFIKAQMEATDIIAELVKFFEDQKKINQQKQNQ